MKKVIELLEEAKRFAGIGLKNDVIYNINDALEELENPLWYTPDRWEQLTGEPWPDNWAVYFMAWFPDGHPVYIDGIWRTMALHEARERASGLTKYIVTIVCATEAGPPPDDWKSEEEGREKRRCRVCGCTDDDCHQCIEKTGKPCHWVEKDLCSACANVGQDG
jgi:hypothetical protein